MTLRRTGGWPRKKPLRSSKPLVPGAPVRSAPLSRRTGMPGVSSGSPVAGQQLRPSRSKVNDGASSLVADVSRVKSPRPKRPKVTAEERRGRKLLAARSGGRCEIGTGCPAQEAHHRKNRSQGGTWDVENLLHLCSAHHLHVTTHPAVARQQGWAVPSTRDPARVPVWLAGRGRHYLTPDGDYVPAERNDAA